MVVYLVLAQVLPRGKHLATFFAAITHVLCIILLDLVLLHGVVPHEPF